MAYSLEGRLLEVCTCKAVCPCWVGEDPDNGTCEGTMAWHIDKGTIDGVDVSGLTFGAVANIPGNVLQGKWKIVAFVDDKANKAQEEALLAVWTGKKQPKQALDDAVKRGNEILVKFQQANK